MKKSDLISILLCLLFLLPFTANSKPPGQSRIGPTPPSDEVKDQQQSKQLTNAQDADDNDQDDDDVEVKSKPETPPATGFIERPRHAHHHHYYHQAVPAGGSNSQPISTPDNQVVLWTGLTAGNSGGLSTGGTFQLAPNLQGYLHQLGKHRMYPTEEQLDEIRESKKNREVGLSLGEIGEHGMEGIIKEIKPSVHFHRIISEVLPNHQPLLYFSTLIELLQTTSTQILSLIQSHGFTVDSLQTLSAVIQASVSMLPDTQIGHTQTFSLHELKQAATAATAAARKQSDTSTLDLQSSFLPQEVITAINAAPTAWLMFWITQTEGSAPIIHFASISITPPQTLAPPYGFSPAQIVIQHPLYNNPKQHGASNAFSIQTEKPLGTTMIGLMSLIAGISETTEFGMIQLLYADQAIKNTEEDIQRKTKRPKKTE